MLRYWPTYEEIERCIKSQAESAAEAVLLAVHQRTPLSVRNVNGSGESEATEADLLDAFLTPNLPEGMLLMPIIGASGVGKSHVIRWLDVQLRRRNPRCEKMIIIRIPKSASLRRVVELILEPLASDPRFGAVRQELRQAVESVVPEEGAIRFAAELKIALGRFAGQVVEQLRENPAAPDRRQQRERLGHAQGLPALFSEPALEAHFRDNVLTRVVQRAVAGQPDNVSEEEDVLPQFAPADFILPPDMALRLGEASQTVQVYYRTVLNREDGAGPQIAADVLNAVADEAVRAVFRLNQSMAGMTIEDIILEIRKSLLADGRELVLLVEDFAALIGIHEVLLRVCIQEAVRDGVQVMAPMRTALSVTEGHLAGRQTILTRARREWLIRSEFDEGDVVRRSIELVGAYLNAARWGEAELRARYQAGRQDGWITAFEDGDLTPADSDLLEAFGRSEAGYRLFPFNRAAIASLAQRHLMDRGRLQFNPRRIIHFILQTVLARRRDFESALFPPPDFEGAVPNPDLAAGLSTLDVNEDVRGRLRSVLYHWGGNPASAAAAAEIPEGVFTAFKLPVPRGLGLPSAGLFRTPPEVTSPASPRAPAATAGDVPVLAGWRRKLDEWAAGRDRLTQPDARYLRNIIARAVGARIDWNALCMKERRVTLDNFEIPFARQGAAVRPRISLAADSRDTDGRLRRFFLAAIRYEENGRNWNYQGAEEDFPLFANMIERLSNRLADEFRQLADEEIAPIADLLVRQSRLLGIGPRRLQTVGELAETMTAPAPDAEADAETAIEGPVGQWEELRREAARCRKDLQERLSALIACYQGGGSTVYGIDASRLDSPLRLLQAGPVEVPDGLLDGPVGRHAVNLRPNRLKVRIDQLRPPLTRFSDRMRDLLGVDGDKAEVIADFKALVSEIEAAGAWPEGNFERARLLRDIEELRGLPAMELRRQAEPVAALDVSEATLDAALDILGKVDFTKIERVTAILTGVEQFIAAAERKVAAESASNQVIRSGPAVEAILNAMDGVIAALADLQLEEVTA